MPEKQKRQSPKKMPMFDENNTRQERITGIITKGVGGLYTVRPDLEGKPVICPAKGAFRHENTVPTVGDRVTVTVSSESGQEGGCVISEIAECSNSLIRPAVSNLTHLFVVIPSARPKPDLLTVDKLVATADERGIEPVIVVNKSDLDAEGSLRIKAIYENAGFSCFLLSAKDGSGCDELFEYFKSESLHRTMISAFAGASAAGKSTLMRRLFPFLDLKMGEVSRKTQRGRHTTRHVELFSVFDDRNCLIADTPGFSMMDFANYNFFELSRLPFAFREFRDCLGECRYTKCTHTKEEGCAVIEKVNTGSIAKERHDNYIAIYNEIKAKPEWKRRKELSGG